MTTTTPRTRAPRAFTRGDAVKVAGLRGVYSFVSQQTDRSGRVATVYGGTENRARYRTVALSDVRHASRREAAVNAERRARRAMGMAPPKRRGAR